jgi:hypothetical protein
MYRAKIPTKKEIIYTGRFVNKSFEVTGTIYPLLSTTKTESKKNKIDSKNMAQRTYYQWFAQTLEDWSLRRAEKREKKKEKARQRLEKHRKKLEAELDKKDEEHMCCDLGYTRCRKCSFYTSPETMLEQIAQQAIKVGQEQKLSPEELGQLQTLILNQKQRKARLPVEFDKFKSVFQCLETTCKNCRHSHAQLHSIEEVCRLQEMKIKLVYENLTVIKFEHDICS